MLIKDSKNELLFTESVRIYFSNVHQRSLERQKFLLSLPKALEYIYQMLRAAEKRTAICIND